jgi:hypothetical protein
MPPVNGKAAKETRESARLGLVCGVSSGADGALSMLQSGILPDSGNFREFGASFQCLV